MRLDDQGGFESQGKNMSVCPLRPRSAYYPLFQEGFFDLPLLNSKEVTI